MNTSRQIFLVTFNTSSHFRFSLDELFKRGSFPFNLKKKRETLHGIRTASWDIYKWISTLIKGLESRPLNRICMLGLAISRWLFLKNAKRWWGPLISAICKETIQYMSMGQSHNNYTLLYDCVLMYVCYSLAST